METTINLIVPRFGQMAVDQSAIEQILLAGGIQTKGQTVRESKISNVLNAYAYTYKNTDEKALLVATDMDDFTALNSSAQQYKENGNVIVLWLGSEPKPFDKNLVPTVSLDQIKKNGSSFLNWNQRKQEWHDLQNMAATPDVPKKSVLSHVRSWFL